MVKMIGFRFIAWNLQKLDIVQANGLALTEILTVSGRFPKRMLWVRLQKYLVHSEINGKQIKLKLIYYSTELKIRLWVLAMQMQITT